MAVTLRDVARQCGLAPSTVSDVLNNRRGTWASSETRRRILEVADVLGYRPNAAARTLRTGKTYVVALVYRTNDSKWQFDGIAEAIAEHLGDYNYSLLLHTYPDQATLLDSLGQMVRAKICDAVVLFGEESAVFEQGKLLEDQGMPFVVKGRYEKEAPHWIQVDYDHEGMMRIAVEHLVRRGHRKIAYLGYALTDVYRERLLQGFHQAIREQTGSDVDEALLGVVDDSPEMADAWLEKWMSLPPSRRPTSAVLNTGDQLWRGLEYALLKSGGGDLTGEFDFEMVGQATRGLTLLKVRGYSFSDLNHRTIAETMVRELLRPLLVDGKIPDRPIRRILPELQPVPATRLDGLRISVSEKNALI